MPLLERSGKLVDEVNRELKTEVEIKKARIAGEQDAEKLRFPGSPTIRVNGVDIDPRAREAKSFVGCRIYRYRNRVYESPPKEMIKNAFQRMLK